MNRLLRTCKCHWSEGEYHHWGRLLRRKPFSPPGTTPKFAPDAPVASRHMRLALHLDLRGERVWGTTRHDCVVHAAEVGEARFNAVALEITRVRVNGKAARYENSGEHVIVALPRKHKRGERLTVEIQHAVTRPAAGLYFTTPDEAYPERFHTAWSQGQDEDSRYYFPCLDSPNFKQTSEALLYVPNGYFALSNGELLAHRPKAAKGEDLWHYRMDLPYSTYLFSVVTGRFASHSERKHKVDVRWFVEQGREAEGRNAFAATADILRFFSDLTGHPYPHKQYTQIAVPDFVFGGMENFTVTTQTDLTLHDDRAHQDFSSNDLVAHEAAHTWFGNMVTARSWAHAWLHESFATYLEALYKLESEGQAEFQYEMLRDAEAYFHEDGLYRRPLVTHRYQEPIDLFDAHLYPGGAVRLRNLHALLGEEAFRAVLWRFIENHKYGVAETVDFARAIEQVTGQNYDWWFEQWIHSAGFPSFELRYSWQAEEKVAVVTIKQTRRLENPAESKQHAPYFRVPTRLAFQIGGKLREFSITADREEARFLFPLQGKPTMVLFDPDFECPVKRVKFEKPQDMLLHQLRHAPGPIARIEAAEALAAKPSQVVTRALARQLKREPFWGVQQRITRALGKVGGKAARDALVSSLSLPHPKARRVVVEVLGHFKKDAVVARTLERKAGGGDDSYYVEAELARALGRARTPNAAEMLRGFLQKPSHMEVIRSAAFDGLAALDDPELLPLIAEGLRYGAPAMSRGAAIRAAGTLGRRHQHLRKRVLDLLQPAAEHKDNPAGSFRGKMAALRALGNLGDLEGLPLLARVAAGEADGRIARLARDTATTLREQAEKPAELNVLRDDLDGVVKENKALRDRLDAVEQKQKPRKPGKKGTAPAKRRQARARG